MALRFDVGRLDRARRTGAGGARVHGSLGRTGVQIYHDANGREVREYRSPDEVFAAETLASLGGIPVTIGHPGAVSAANWRDVARGHVSDAPPGRRQDGQLEWLESQVVISDAPTLSKVDAGELVELSLGYTADVVDQPGVAPDGTRYDRVQKNIRFNHLALLQDGRARAGRGARLRLDASGNAVIDVDIQDRPSVDVSVSLNEHGQPYYNIHAQGLSPDAVRPFLAQTAQNVKDLAAWNNVAALKEIR